MKKIVPLVCLFAFQGIAFGQSNTFSDIEVVAVPPPEAICQLHIIQEDLGTYVPPPGGISNVLGGGTSTINVTYIDEPSEPWPQEAIDAFEFAAAIWASHIDSPTPIEIDAEWSDLGGCNLMNGVTLGAAGPTFGVTFGGSPIANTVYPCRLIQRPGRIGSVSQFIGYQFVL